MIRLSAKTRDQIFVKVYEFSSFAKNVDKNIGKFISKNLSSKCSQKLLDYSKEYTTNARKTVSKTAFQKMSEETGDLIGNKIADKITKVSRVSPQKSSEIVKNEAGNIGFDREIPKERYISPEKRQKIIDNLRLM